MLSYDRVFVGFFLTIISPHFILISEYFAFDCIASKAGGVDVHLSHIIHCGIFLFKNVADNPSHFSSEGKWLVSVQRFI